MAATGHTKTKYNQSTHKMLTKPKQYANGYSNAYEFSASSFMNNVLGLNSRYAYEEQNRLATPLSLVKFVAASKDHDENDDNDGQKNPDAKDENDDGNDNEHDMNISEKQAMMVQENENETEEHPSLLTSTCNLSIGQCKRYQRLLHDLYHSGNAILIASAEKRREFKALKVLVEEERVRYRKALLAFRREHANRFLIGFRVGDHRQNPISKLVRVASARVQAYENQLEQQQMSIHYGKCYQQISLERYATSIQDCDVILPSEGRKVKKQQQRNTAPFQLEAFQAKNVHSSCSIDGLQKCSSVEQFNSNSLKRIPLAPNQKLEERVSDVHFKNRLFWLRDDPTALRLASEHGAQAIITAGTLSLLLQRPGAERWNRWKIPVEVMQVKKDNEHKNKNDPKIQHRKRKYRGATSSIAIFDRALPHALSTRECLSKGLEGPLFGALMLTDENENYDPNDGEKEGRTETIAQRHEHQYVYTVVHIDEIKILVRSINDMQSDGCPVKRHVQLEYFSERGMEVYSAHQRVQWMLEKLLQPNAIITVGRVDLKDGAAELICVEGKSIAHALGGDDAHLELNFDPMQHFKAAAAVFRGVGKLSTGRFLACFPSVTTNANASTNTNTSSVSIHQRIEDVSSCSRNHNHHAHKSNNLAIIDVQGELEDAEAVYTSESSLLACFRMWQWPSFVAAENTADDITMDGGDIPSSINTSILPYTLPMKNN